MSYILLFEGGFSDVLDDPGGATNYGITQQTYDEYRFNKNYKQQSVKYITMEEVYDCYYKTYYLKSGCDTLPPVISFVHMDASINFGILKSKKLLLQTLNDVKIDSSNDKEMAIKYIDTREQERYNIVKRNEKKRKFLRGWLNRDEKIKNIILTPY